MKRGTLRGRVAATFVALWPLTLFPAAAGAGVDDWSADRAAGLHPTTVGTAARPWRRILRVGPGRRLAAPSAAAAIARDGDRIRIDAADYRDCAVWRQNDLFIEGVGGRPHIRGSICAGQAIWLIAGSRIAIRNVAFSGARAPAGNGAAIKFTGRTLTLADGVFHDSENGILTGPGARSRIRIAASIFRGNGRCAAHCAHGLYVGHVARLTVVDSVFLRQRIAHHIKSRARFTEIAKNRIADGPDGTASYAIDLPDGGAALIRGNVLHKGARSDNPRAMIAIAAESAANPPGAIVIRGNRFANDHPHAAAFVVNFGGVPGVVLDDNRFDGPGEALSGPGRVVP
jgi:hypothetical protein